MFVGDWRTFWETLRNAPRVLLALDYDGTLAPFRPDRMQAAPSPGVVPLLRDIAAGAKTTLAILSGRPIKELMTLIGGIDAVLVGCHGWEIKRASGVSRSYSITGDQKRVLDLACRRRSEPGAGFFMEKKIASVAFHTRQAPASLVAAAEDEVFHYWSDLAGRHGMECRRFNGGVELRCPERHKGTALAEILKEQPEATLGVYLGDDDTDEDAFRCLAGIGIGIKVGGEKEKTHASLFLAECAGVPKFLGEFLAAVG